ncbi:MAG TPA: ornithine carbamoyltransferase [Candidatus Krumholzibacteria bacterium]|nr:ornithine carbamoyltransferase [Candidatus Krumholzibacteria bacterium]
MSLRGRSFISMHDFDAEEIATMLRVATRLKDELRAGKEHRLLRGRTLGMIFQKNSTRTRVSFEVGMGQLGGQALFLSSQDLQLNRGETIADTARVLGRYLDGIMARTYAHADVEDLARYSGVPVINGLSDLLHPCQGLADLMTIQEKKGRLAGIKLAYMGDSNNVTHSLLQAGALMGMQVRVGSPAGYQPRPDILAQAHALAARSGAEIRVVEDPVAAVRGADVIYTDTWASMGQEAEHDQRVRLFRPYQVDAALMAQAAPDALFMHCLPAHRGEEVTDQVMDGPHSVIFDQAENRLHAQKAILALIMR